jgi:prepilin-type N-terminal cleavage/methylation domain-containing protein
MMKNILGFSGFSLIEILICVAIITVLVSIGVVQYQGAVDMSEMKFAVPEILKDLESYHKLAVEKNSIVTVEFVMGTSALNVYLGSGTQGVLYSERNFKNSGLLKRKLNFREYRWPDGASTPTTFTFFPAAQAQGGVVTFGSGFAEVDIYLGGNRPQASF